MKSLITAQEAKNLADTRDQRRREELLTRVNKRIKEASEYGGYKDFLNMEERDAEYIQNVLKELGFKTSYDKFGATLHVEWDDIQRMVDSLEEKTVEFEHRLMKMAREVVNAKFLSYDREFPTDSAPQAVTVRCYLFTEDGSRIEADIELSEAKTEELFEGM